MSWARKNVATLVTWAVLALGAAVALGATTTEIGEIRKDVDQATELFEAARNGQAYHLQAVRRVGDPVRSLMGRVQSRNQDDPVQRKEITGLVGQIKVPVVDGIETASQHPDCQRSMRHTVQRESVLFQRQGTPLRCFREWCRKRAL